ncbi:MAG: adenylate/guanylate cyclase domain-containing protein [Melioribacteraceae bacterium]|nr:adenylate/guanylate cyclase domain-containing protein [Melioribacteraceae bacterium]
MKRYICREIWGFPEYKAGLHCGEVSVAQIGSIKKDIAFHGDPMNTTSRICLTCNEVGEELLISKDLLNELSPNGDYEFKEMGEFMLKGKKNSVELFGIRQINNQ